MVNVPPYFGCSVGTIIGVDAGPAAGFGVGAGAVGAVVGAGVGVVGVVAGAGAGVVVTAGPQEASNIAKTRILTIGRSVLLLMFTSYRFVST